MPGWCNGSTSDFDSLSLGSNPGPGARFMKYSKEWEIKVSEDGDVVDVLLGGKFKFWLSVKNAEEMRDALTDAIEYCEKNRRKNLSLRS